MNNENKQYYIVRTYSAGVFAGYIESRKGEETVMTQARRIWRWEGAASLSQLAMEGTAKPNDCKFPIPMDRVILLRTIEVIEATEKARLSIASVPVWSA